MRSSYTIPAAIVFGGIIIAIAVYVSVPKAPSTAGNAALVRPVSSADHIIGNPAAPVVIIEYADFDCESCRGFHDAMHQIIANKGANGKVAWVFREFPLTETNPNALALARAAECAAAVSGSDSVASNSAFWKFANALYASQPVDPTDLGTIAATAGISGNAFANCYANTAATVDARVNADRQNALDMGAKDTPFSVIVTNGKSPVVMDGAFPYDAVSQLVDQALGN